MKKALNRIRGIPQYLADFMTLRGQAGSSSHSFPFGTFKPKPGDRYGLNGDTARGQYFHQDFLVARRIFINNPKRHLDVGSRVAGFIAHVASYREIEAIDIRPMNKVLPNIKFLQADLMADLPPHFIECCDSLSCLHTIEHFGLGRYGDPVNFEGHLLGLENLRKILKPGGKFYFSTPIGPQRIEFNAHRVFSVDYLAHLLEQHYTIEHFSYVDDRGDLHEDVGLTPELRRTSCGCRRGCGIFELTKR